MAIKANHAPNETDARNIRKAAGTRTNRKRGTKSRIVALAKRKRGH